MKGLIGGKHFLKRERRNRKLRGMKWDGEFDARMYGQGRRWLSG